LYGVVNTDGGLAFPVRNLTSHILSTQWPYIDIILDKPPSATFGATFFVSDSTGSLTSSRGILAGGISEDAILQQSIWEWEIKDFTCEVGFTLPELPEPTLIYVTETNH